MPYYMIQLGYRPDAWDALIDHPVNRLDVVKPAIESLGRHEYRHARMDCRKSPVCLCRDNGRRVELFAAGPGPCLP